jgi:hypothetical protein
MVYLSFFFLQMPQRESTDYAIHCDCLFHYSTEIHQSQLKLYIYNIFTHEFINGL